MATNCEDISAQMMDLLYGEVPADARATIDAHVAGCARCRAELEGFEKTRAVARRALDEAPPARARAAIMQAAAAHLATKAQPAAGRQPAAPARVSLWARLRLNWALPTFATVGAVAVFVIANRVFLNPERALEPRPAATQGAPASTPPAMAAPGEAPGEAANAAGEKGAKRERLDEPVRPGVTDREHRRQIADAPMPDIAAEAKPTAAAGAGSTGKKAKKGGVSAFAEPPAAKAPAAFDKDELAANKFAPPPPPREGGPTVHGKQVDKASPLEEAPVASAPAPSAPARKPAPKPATAAKGRALDDSLEDDMGDARAGIGSVGASSPGGGAARGKSDGYGSGAARAQAAQPARAENNEMSRSAPAAAAAPPPAPSAAAPVAITKSRAKKKADVSESGEALAAAPEPAAERAAKDEKKSVGGAVGNVGSSGKNSANDVIMQRADRLFSEGRWAEAAALYRELLRRDPRNDDSDRWRRRLVAAENADLAEKRANVAARREAQGAEQADAETTARTRKPAAAAKAKAAPAKAAASDAAQ